MREVSHLPVHSPHGHNGQGLELSLSLPRGGRVPNTCALTAVPSVPVSRKLEPGAGLGLKPRNSGKMRPSQGRC